MELRPGRSATPRSYLFRTAFCAVLIAACMSCKPAEPLVRTSMDLNPIRIPLPQTYRSGTLRIRGDTEPAGIYKLEIRKNDPKGDVIFRDAYIGPPTKTEQLTAEDLNGATVLYVQIYFNESVLGPLRDPLLCEKVENPVTNPVAALEKDFDFKVYARNGHIVQSVEDIRSGTFTTPIGLRLILSI